MLLSILPDISEDGKNRNFIINLFKYAAIPSDIWSVGTEPISTFEFMWHASFTDFFIKLRRYNAIGKQLLISNEKKGFAEQF
jgi:hypothetical protein